MFKRKMLRDMLASKVQFASIFILAFLGVFVYSGMRAQWEGMEKQSQLFYESSSLSDLYIMGYSFDDTTREKINALSGIKSTQLRLDLDIVTELESRPTLRLMISNDNLISRPQAIEGNDFDNETQGIWLDKNFAHAHDIQIGDYLTLPYSNMLFELPVIGLILHPEYVYNVRDHSQIIPDSMLFGYAYTNESSLNLPFSLTYNQVLVKLETSTDKKYIINEINNIPGVFHIMEQDDHHSVASFNAEIEQQIAMSSLFPILFFFVAALCMLTTMSRLVLSQRTLIGTFMGLGFSRKKILFHYTSYGLWLGLIGGFLGLVSGPLLISELLFSFQQVFYSLPTWRPHLSAPVLISGIASATVCVFASYIACVRELKESPAEALRPKAPKVGTHTPLEKTKIWHNLSFANKWNLRDILRSRVRSLMAIAGVAGCMMMLVWGIGIFDSINRMQDWYFDDLQQFESKVLVDADFDIQTALKTGNQYQAVQEIPVHIEADNTKDIVGLRIFDYGDLILFESPNGLPLSLPSNGISVSSKTADMYNLAKGDAVFLRLLGEDDAFELIISSIHRTPFEQGLIMSRETYEDLGLSMSPNLYLIGENTTIDSDSKGIIEIQNMSFLMESFGQLLDGIYAVVFVLFAAAVLLGCVILYNLGSLSFSERLRELATLRVLGFHLPLIRKLLRRQTILLSVIGILIGTPLGYFFLNILTQTMSDDIDFPSYIAPISIIICAIGTLLVALITDQILGCKTKKIDMVSALKSIE